ncbi:cystathione beta-lyase [Formivibrio citricus]|uniref:Putative 8-amino-7-oxononanoate synthase n=1 Tax=Formivibrio citricus TaxID=83765 RepID=A0A1I5CE89_9NEIS|nr:PatB family C-S lyase [Formivibrio citricus]SFN85122.1 cystathione beta-lyase [Formivibrio citricus]
MFFDFDAVIPRQGTSSLKWEKYAGRDVLPLWVADMDFAAPPAVIEALHARIDHGIFGYTRSPASANAAVVEYLQARYGWAIQPEWIVWLPGLVPGINLACRAVGEPGDAALTCTPVYPPFLFAPGLNQLELVAVPLCEQAGEWQFDFAAMKAAITPRTRLLILCHPHNPVGRIWRREELTQLADFARQYDLTVVSDEIHCDLLLDEGARHLPFACVSEDAGRRAITLMAPSKTYNLPGLSCSLAVIPDAALRQAFQRAMRGIMPEVNALGYTATEAAFRHGGEWLEALLAYLRGNCDRVVAALDGVAGLRVTRPQATYLAWIDCRESSIESPQRFFEEAGVGLSDGADFGLPGFVRLNFGCPRATLDQALKRMRTALLSR